MTVPVHAVFRCPRCGHQVWALATNRLAHRCPHPETGHACGPEIDFIRIDPET
jgi:predicted RNA-binding Zn-ribbon protein involved in translation (DUF1610 family)